MQKYGLNWQAVVFATALLGGCGEPDRFAEGWDRGGNMHDTSLRDWAFATDANRLATSADFIREYLPEMPAEALPLSSALIERCLSERSQSAAMDFITVRSRIEPCIDYVARQANRLSQELAQKEALRN